ncbi:hypothetical protein RF11_15387 [Thelohanellus kitauei]|uniref:Uncharacterized protein n=1 Tax=Thelohanellus kitauei TaxID=669202 RepID=A0A0C2M7D5_THEKT|nr:hypothetical protein RF11_15387 [Thelohanellus kitauei]
MSCKNERTEQEYFPQDKIRLIPSMDISHDPSENTNIKWPTSDPAELHGARSKDVFLSSSGESFNYYKLISGATHQKNGQCICSHRPNLESNTSSNPQPLQLGCKRSIRMNNNSQRRRVGSPRRPNLEQGNEPNIFNGINLGEQRTTLPIDSDATCVLDRSHSSCAPLITDPQTNTHPHDHHPYLPQIEVEGDDESSGASTDLKEKKKQKRRRNKALLKELEKMIRGDSDKSKSETEILECCEGALDELRETTIYHVNKNLEVQERLIDILQEIRNEILPNSRK